MDMTALRALMFRGGGTGGGGGGGSGMELVKEYTYDKKMIQDGIVQSFPSYTTSAQTLVASDTIEQIEIDKNNYFYFVFTRGLTIPIYNTTSKAAGREEYSFISYLGYPYYGRSGIPIISDPEITIDQSTTGMSKQSGEQLLVYWTANEVTWITSGTYGAYQKVTNIQTTGGNLLVVKTPSFMLAGSTTYLNSTFWAALTDIRYQYVIDVYRTPKQNAKNTYFGNYEYIIDCIKTNDHKLT